MGVRCPHCHEDAVVWEGYATQDEDASQRVCQSCGAVLQEGSFQDETGQALGGFQPLGPDSRTSVVESSTLPSAYLKTVKSADPSALTLSTSIKSGISKIKILAQFICTNQKQLINEAINLFKEIYRKYKIHQENKEIGAACCLMIVCRNNGIPVTVHYLCSVLSYTVSQVGAQLALLREHGYQSRGVDIDSLITSICNDTDCSKGVINNIRLIIPIMKEAWIIDGRVVDICIKAACYVCWKAEEVKSRNSVYPKTFMDMQGWTLNRTTYNNRIKEILNSLRILASGIPWLTPADIKGNQVLHHLQDLLTFQRSLLHNLKDSEDEDSETPDVAAEQAPTSGQKRKRIDEHSYSCLKSTETDEYLSSKENQQVFRPSSFVSGLKKPNQQLNVCNFVSIDPNHDLDSTELSAADVADSELHQYLKSEEELRSQNLLELKMKIV